MNKESENSTREDDLLNVKTEDIHSGTENVNDAFYAFLQSMNRNVESTNESLKTLQSNGETQTPQRAESARKRKSPSTGGSGKWDADTLLADDKRQKVARTDSNGATCSAASVEENDPLFDGITQSLTDKEKTAPEVSN